MSNHRARARELARQHLLRGDALGWFERLYAESQRDGSMIPWSDLRANPNLVSWFDRPVHEISKGTALVVGCGLGDDAEYLAMRGFNVTAFDISPTAIAWCQQRFPDSAVKYVVGDLFQIPGDWRRAFDLVVEAYTLQVLPAAMRASAMRDIAECIAPGGLLVVICRAREPPEPEGEMPWPLTRGEFAIFHEAGLVEAQFEDYRDQEIPPVRRFRVTYQRARN